MEGNLGSAIEIRCFITTSCMKTSYKRLRFLFLLVFGIFVRHICSRFITKVYRYTLRTKATKKTPTFGQVYFSVFLVSAIALYWQ